MNHNRLGLVSFQGAKHWDIFREWYWTFQIVWRQLINSYVLASIHETATKYATFHNFNYYLKIIKKSLWTHHTWIQWQHFCINTVWPSTFETFFLPPWVHIVNSVASEAHLTVVPWRYWRALTLSPLLGPTVLWLLTVQWARRGTVH